MTATEWPPLPIDLLRAWDADRPRSKQTDLGWSAVGGCRRHAKYIDLGVEPTDSPDKAAAWLGTLIHEGLAESARKHAGPNDLVEEEVWFHGVRGHLDWLTSSRRGGPLDTVVDWKSVSLRRMEAADEEGPNLNQRHQTTGYGAAAVMMGYPIRWIVLDYIGRDGGKVLRHRRPFEMADVRAAVAWIDNIRETPLEAVPRDYRPGSVFCDGCEFLSECWGAYTRPGRNPRSALYVDNPDAPWWRTRLKRARALKKRASEWEADARGALDAIRPNEKGRVDAVVDDDGEAIRWSVGKDRRADLDTIKEDYERAGATVPMKESPKVTVSVVKRPKDAVGHSGEPSSPDLSG